MEWHSPRYHEQLQREQQVKAFDTIIDLALDGVVSMEQAILGCHEIADTIAEIENGAE